MEERKEQPNRFLHETSTQTCARAHARAGVLDAQAGRHLRQRVIDRNNILKRINPRSPRVRERLSRGVSVALPATLLNVCVLTKTPKAVWEWTVACERVQRKPSGVGGVQTHAAEAGLNCVGAVWSGQLCAGFESAGSRADRLACGEYCRKTSVP
eukprot:365901-Chlamydomonas_euryale.AAC.8